MKTNGITGGYDEIEGAEGEESGKDLDYSPERQRKVKAG